MPRLLNVERQSLGRNRVAKAFDFDVALARARLRTACSSNCWKNAHQDFRHRPRFSMERVADTLELT